MSRLTAWVALAFLGGRRDHQSYVVQIAGEHHTLNGSFVNQASAALSASSRVHPNTRHSATSAMGWTLTTRAVVAQQHRSHPPTLIVLAMNLRWSASHGDHRFDLRLDRSGLTPRYRSCSRFAVTQQ
jgi:hypothetical protein